MDNSNTDGKPTVAFLLKAYEECWGQARHLDEYMERMPRFFLVIAGAVIAGVVALLRFSEVTDLSFTFAGAGLIVLALIGLSASLTIPRYRVIRNDYFNAIYRINKYFADHSQSLNDYLGYALQIGGEFGGYYRLGVDFFRFMMMTIMDIGLIASGLYTLQNHVQLAALFSADNSGILLRLPLSVSWLICFLPAFVVVHISLYFVIVSRYKPKIPQGKASEAEHA